MSPSLSQSPFPHKVIFILQQDQLFLGNDSNNFEERNIKHKWSYALSLKPTLSK